jgi:hypothetical protein
MQFIKAALTLSAIYFLYCFLRDSYEELFLNPVHFFDDAYMFIRYARIWHMGYGEAWNIGEAPVYGNTSQLHFLFVLLLTSFPAMTDDMVIKGSSALPSYVLLFWLPWFAARHASLFPAHARWQKYLLWMGIVCPLWYRYTPFSYHAYTGMDTALSALLTLWLIDVVLTYDRSGQRRWLPVLVLLVYLGYLTRPENIVSGSLFVALYLGVWRKRFRQTVSVAIAVVILLLLDALVKYWYFGDVVPMAFYTKSSGFFEGFAGKFHNHPLFPIFYILLAVWPFFALLIFSVKRDQTMGLLAFLLPAVVVTAYFFTMQNIMNLYARYEYPLTMYIIAAALLYASTDLFQPFRKKPVIVAALLSVALYQALAYGDSQVGNLIHYLLRDTENAGVCENGVLNYPLNLPGPVNYSWKDKMFQMTDAFRDAPVGTTVVTTEHGYFGAKNLNVTIIDVAGLHNRYMAHHGFSAEWLYAQKPDVIWLPHWHYTCLNHKLVFNEEFRQHYKLYPGLFNLGIALRTDSPRYAVLYQLVDREVAKIYPGHHLPDYEQTVE